MNTLLRLMQRRKWDVTGLTANTSMTLTIAERIDISAGTEIELIVRVHRSTLAAGTTIAVNLVADVFDSMDPGNIFVVPGLQIATIPISGTTAPTGQSAVAQSISARFAALQIVLTRTTNGGDADVSVDLGLKSYQPYMPSSNSFLGFRY